VALFGLIGYPLSHSWSKEYFTNFFTEAGLLHHRYELFPLQEASGLGYLIETHPGLCGLNVTIPLKSAIIPFVDELDPVAKAIGAVNTILIRNKNGITSTIGFNTDWIGFMRSLPTERNFQGALILGTGGASLAVACALHTLGIPFRKVSRFPSGSEILSYSQIDSTVLNQYNLIINATPAGMYPEINTLPQLPYKLLNAKHFLYDLIYNPPQTRFLEAGIRAGSQGMNGLRMLHLQAEEAWKIWQSGHFSAGGPS